MFDLLSHKGQKSPNLLLRRRAERAEKQLQAVIKISRALALAHERKQLLKRIIETATEVMEADRSTLYLIDEETQELVSQIIQGEESIQIRIPIGQGVAGWVAQTGETVNLIDAYKDPRFHVNVDQKTGYTTRSILTMPLRASQGQIIAVIQVLNKSNGLAFSEEDEQLLEAISAQATIFLENASLYAQVVQANNELSETSRALQQRNYELDILFAIEQQMSGAFELDEMLANILSRSTEMLHCEAGFIGLLDKNKQLVLHNIKAEKTEKANEWKGRSLKTNDSLMGWSIRYSQPILSNAPTKDARFKDDFASQLGLAVRGVLCVPLLNGDTSIGAIEMINKRSGAEGFTDSDLRILSLIAARVSRAVSIGIERNERMRQSRLATIGKLLSGIVHDFKTPMTLISGYAQLTATQEDPEKRKSFAQMIQKQIERLNHMTREVLAFARGESTLLIRKVHLNQFASELKQHLEQEFAHIPIQLDFQCSYTGDAHFDESKIERLLHNLSRNAIQAMPDGGHFSLHIDQDGDQLVIVAQDTGIGIPLELQPKIFDSFVTGRPNQGTGLGLAIVKKIVQEHQGHISFTSEPNKGTAFRVTLPLKGPTQLSPAQQAEAA